MASSVRSFVVLVTSVALVLCVTVHAQRDLVETTPSKDGTGGADALDLGHGSVVGVWGEAWEVHSQGPPGTGRKLQGPPGTGRKLQGPPESGRKLQGPPESGRKLHGPPAHGRKLQGRLGTGRKLSQHGRKLSQHRRKLAEVGFLNNDADSVASG